MGILCCRPWLHFQSAAVHLHVCQQAWPHTPCQQDWHPAHLKHEDQSTPTTGGARPTTTVRHTPACVDGCALHVCVRACARAPARARDTCTGHMLVPTRERLRG